jgi:hypothetical protein|nr:MAG TPA: hypothetical protein [Caudoviricetes sp.]
MDSEDGKSYYGIGIDNSELRRDAEEARQILVDIDKQVERATHDASEAARVPNVDVSVNVETNAPEVAGELTSSLERVGGVIGRQREVAQEFIVQVDAIGQEAREQSDRVRELLTDIPTVNIDFVSNAPDTAQAIEQAFAELDRVYDANKRGIVELEAEYRRLAEEQRKANNRGDGKGAVALREQKAVVEQVIATRKKLLAEIEATADQLHKEENALRSAGEQAKQAGEKHISLRQRLREIKTALVEMEAAGQRGTAQYQALQAEAARLTDAWSDASAQATILAHDQRGMQGVISGLSGLSGAASVAQGAMGLFGAENEKLQQIMLRVQSVMAITMGLQQIQQTLNKDSAFSLVTLNSLKKIWNKLLGESAVKQSEEAVSTTASTVATTANTAATTANTASRATNNAAATTGVTAQRTLAGSTVLATAATTAQAVATRAASIALRGLKAALISTGIGALVVAVGELVGWLSSLASATSEAEEKAKQMAEITSKGNEAYIKARVEIDNYQLKLERYSGSKEKEKQIVKELNSKYGEALGYYKSAAEWKRILQEKGDAYANSMLKEAEAQAILSKYTEAYIALQDAKNKKAAEYGSWYTSDARDELTKKRAIEKLQKEADELEATYRKAFAAAEQTKQTANIGGHVDPTTTKSKTSGRTFDPAKAALEERLAREAYAKDAKKYIKEAQDELTKLAIDAQEAGLTRELNEIRQGTKKQLEALNDRYEAIAEARKAEAKAIYMSKKGATEVGWANSAEGKRTTKDWQEVVAKDSPEIARFYERMWQAVTANGERAIKAAQQKYHDALIDEFGSIQDKEDKLLRDWSKRLATMPLEFQDEAVRKMDEELSKISSERFRKAIDWESVFGDLTKQALPVLEYTLGRVRQYFEANKGVLSTQEIKDYQEAIKNMESEIAGRNPFASLHKAIRDVSLAKVEYTDAIAAMVAAQDRLTEAQRAYNEALREKSAVQDAHEDQTTPEFIAAIAEANEKLAAAQKEQAKAQDESDKAARRAMQARNGITASYANLTTSLRNVGGVLKDVGGKAKLLASVFSTDVAEGLAQVVDFTGEVIDATSSAIQAVGDVGKSVAKGVADTVQSASAGATAAATAGATAVSMVEKASVVLAVISAALQVATAIANLFNNDGKKQKQIERLQAEIDQLQWELSNTGATRLSAEYGDALEKVRDLYSSTRDEVMALRKESIATGSAWERMFAVARNRGEIFAKTVEKIADAYAKMSYTANKALGEARLDDGRAKLENLAKQQLLVKEQLEAEQGKKKTDNGKVAEYKQKLAEIGNQMAEALNEPLEKIIGSSAESLASELGNAFFDAAKAGEDAMEGWHKKTNEIVGDILRRMLITQYLEPEIGRIFNTYKNRWFDERGAFRGIDEVKRSSADLAKEIEAVGEKFKAQYGILEEVNKKFITEDGGRTPSQKGIATASQDSIDELNGRMTAVQGHTFAISEHTRQLTATTGLILQSIVNIESETNGFGARLARMEASVKRTSDTLEEIALTGIKVK